MSRCAVQGDQGSQGHQGHKVFKEQLGLFKNTHFDGLDCSVLCFCYWDRAKTEYKVLMVLKVCNHQGCQGRQGY
jgi:hypothetical protein